MSENNTSFGISAVSVSSDSIAVAFSLNTAGSEGFIIIFDKSGKIRYNIETDFKINDLSLVSSDLYVLSTEKVCRYYFDDESGKVTYNEAACEFGIRSVFGLGEFALISDENHTYSIFGSNDTDNKN